MPASATRRPLGCSRTGIAQKSVDSLQAAGLSAVVRSVDLGPLAVDIAQGLVTGVPNERVNAAMESLGQADAVIAATPVYKAGISGLFKSFVDLLDNDLLIGRPVVLAATGGSERHATIVDDHLRPLFAFLRAVPVPTSLYAAPDDWASADLSKRITRAASELTLMLQSGVGREMATDNWAGYQHQFGSRAAGAERTVADVDFDTDLMRLATGGALPPLPRAHEG